MEQRELKIELRDRTGKNACRQLRSKGLIPGIVYGKGIESVSVVVNPKELCAALAGEGGRNNLLALKGVSSLEGSLVIVSDILTDSLKGNIVHVDLHKLNMAEKVRVHVSIQLIGTAVGVKEGGLLDFAMHSVDVECLPSNIPEHIEVDVTSLALGHSLHVRDLQLPEGVKVLEDSRASVVSVLGRAKDESAAPAAE